MSLPSSHKRGDIENQNFANEVYNYDWSSTPLGSMDTWDPAIKTATSLCLKSVFPICLFIGPPHWIQLYNKAWEPIFQSKPYALGKSFKETWPEVYDVITPLFESVRTTKKGIYRKEDYYELHRDGYTEETYFDYTYSPVFKLDGSVYAIITIAQETTQKVLNARRLKILGEFGRRMPEIESLENSSRIATEVLSNNKDITYALIYIVESRLNAGSKSIIARLASTTFDEDDKKEYQFPDYFPDTPKIIDLSKDVDKSYNYKYITLKRHVATYSFVKCDESWPLDLVIKEGKHIKVLLKDGSQVVLLLANSFCGDQTLSAILICGINRLRTLDEKYMEFLQLAVNQMNTCLLQGKTREEEKNRAKLLADLNFQKVSFFQGISHELKSILFVLIP
ncbi:PAS domain S-box protein [Gigaspora margarita]|uniref:PAS domain S-box protein n=1 Tax=Gigaspora margarita TaxID=4874 RepID=A0A8H4A9V9_GIGMA|nr:PAS domain S-box protein [Gigaspora margarita]